MWWEMFVFTPCHIMISKNFFWILPSMNHIWIAESTSQSLSHIYLTSFSWRLTKAWAWASIGSVSPHFYLSWLLEPGWLQLRIRSFSHLLQVSTIPRAGKRSRWSPQVNFPWLSCASHISREVYLCEQFSAGGRDLKRSTEQHPWVNLSFKIGKPCWLIYGALWGPSWSITQLHQLYS